MNETIEKFNKIILFFVIYTLVFILFFKTLSYTLPFVLAILFAFILQKPTNFLMKRLKLKNSIASLITTIIFFTVIIILFSFGISSLINEIIQLTKSAQLYFANSSDKINNLVDTLQKYYNNLDPSLIQSIKSNFSSTVSKIGNITVSISGKVVSIAISFISTIPYVIMVILFTLLATYFFTKDISSAKNKFKSLIPEKSTDRLSFIISESKKMMGNYVVSYLIIISFTFVETLIGFFIFKVKYAVILSILSAFFDILPILGIGSVYIPIAIIYFLYKNYFTAFGVLILYAIVSIIRQIIEPKIVSSSLGLHPVAVLAALFIGLKANGISGMFFCIFLVIFYNILKKVDIL